MNITRKMIHSRWNLSVESQRTMGHNEQFRTIGLETAVHSKYYSIDMRTHSKTADFSIM